MELFLIRHADALPLGEGGTTDDEQRPLSAEGKKQAQALGRCLRDRGLTFDLILSSPLLRAQQTTELMLKAAGLEGVRVSSTAALTPNARPKKLSSALMKVNAERVAAVGHLPHLAVFAAWVLGSKKAQLDFAKAGVARISCGDSPIKGNGSLQWLITPEWFT